MTHDEAVADAKKHLYLVDKKFRLKDGETETIKTVVAWDEGKGNWRPHVCFYDWKKSEDGEIFHLPVDEFFRRYEEVK